jgi:hypothetical protein
MALLKERDWRRQKEFLGDGPRWWRTKPGRARTDVPSGGKEVPCERSVPSGVIPLPHLFGGRDWDGVWPVGVCTVMIAFPRTAEIQRSGSSLSIKSRQGWTRGGYPRREQCGTVECWHQGGSLEIRCTIICEAPLRTAAWARWSLIRE